MRIAALLGVLLALGEGGGAGRVEGARAQQAGVKVDAGQKAVLVPCKIAPRKLANLPEVYPIEVIATHPSPKGQKAHETVVVFDVAPSEVHKALESLGLKPGKPARGEDANSGPELDLTLELPGGKKVSFESVLLDKKTGRPLPDVRWRFTGSALKEGKFGADVSGTLVSLFPVTDETVIQSSLTMREEGMIKLETAKHILPAEGTAATLVIKAGAGAPRPAGAAALKDPEGQVLRLSQSVGPGPLAPPAVGLRHSAPAAVADPFEHRREIRPGKALQDSVRPVR